MKLLNPVMKIDVAFYLKEIAMIASSNFGKGLISGVTRTKKLQYFKPRHRLPTPLFRIDFYSIFSYLYTSQWSLLLGTE